MEKNLKKNRYIYSTYVKINKLKIKNKRENFLNLNIIAGMKNILDEIYNQIHMAKWKMSELENISIELSKIKYTEG